MRGNEQKPIMKEKRRCAMKMAPPAPSSEGAVIKYICGIDIGSQSCVGCISHGLRNEINSSKEKRKRLPGMLHRNKERRMAFSESLIRAFDFHLPDR